MIDKELSEIILKEEEALKKVLVLLDEQYKNIMTKNVFELEALVDRIKACNKQVAEIEVSRRKLIGNKSMKEIVSKTHYKDLSEGYRRTVKLIESIKFQKDTNELLIKQQIGFNNQIINVINPRRENKTYNSYGKLTR